MTTKRTLTIIAFFLLSSLPMLAQQIWWIDTTSAGVEKRVYLGNFNAGYNSGGINIGRLPVTLDTVNINTFPGEKTYADVRNSWDWARSHTTYRDSVQNVVDTILIVASEWSKIWIRPLETADSIEYAVGTTAATWHRLDGSSDKFESDKLNITYFTKVFIRAYSGDNSIKQYQVTIEGF